MIKILHIGLSSNVGGMETVVYTWLKLMPANIHFDFVNLEDKPLAFEAKLKKHGCNIFNVTPRKKNPIRCRMQLKKIILQGNYDYVHHHVMSLSWLDPEIITSKLGVKCVVHSHSVLEYRNLSIKYKVLHWYGSKIISRLNCLELACGCNAGFTMFKNKNYTVINNGIDMERFKFEVKNREVIRKKYGVEDFECLIGHVGRPGYPKNYPYIIKTFSLLLKENKNFKLLLIGDIKNDKEINGLVDKYSIRDRVIFTGSVRNNFQFYSAMDIFFFPSFYEGISVSLVEAQTSGLKCLISKFIDKESIFACKNVEFVDLDNPCKTVEMMTDYYKEFSQADRYIEDCGIYDFRLSAKKIKSYYLSHLETNSD